MRFLTAIIITKKVILPLISEGIIFSPSQLHCSMLIWKEEEKEEEDKKSKKKMKLKKIWSNWQFYHEISWLKGNIWKWTSVFLFLFQQSIYKCIYKKATFSSLFLIHKRRGKIGKHPLLTLFNFKADNLYLCINQIHINLMLLNRNRNSYQAIRLCIQTTIR